MDDDDLRGIARHFYDLGCRRAAEKYNEIEYNRQRAEDSVPNDHEEAAKEYCPDDAYPFGPAIINRDIRLAFIAGAKWQKEQDMDEWIKDRDGCFWDGVNEGKKAMEEQMMKEAVEGEIQMRYSGCLCAKTIRAINEDKFKFGDKVRIIIVKED